MTDEAEPGTAPDPNRGGADRADRDSRNEIWLREPEQMRALSSPLRVALFERLVHGPSTARALAEDLDVPQTRLYYHLRILERTGFIEVVSERRRRGSIERTFGVTATEVKLDSDAMADASSTGEPIRSAMRLAANEMTAAYRAGRGDDVFIEQAEVRLSEAEFGRLRDKLRAWIKDVERSRDPDGEVERRVTIAMHPTAASKDTAKS